MKKYIACIIFVFGTALAGSADAQQHDCVLQRSPSNAIHILGCYVIVNGQRLYIPVRSQGPAILILTPDQMWHRADQHPWGPAVLTQINVVVGGQGYTGTYPGQPPAQFPGLPPAPRGWNFNVGPPDGGSGWTPRR